MFRKDPKKNPGNLQDKYCVIIDAGSSGSRVHIYQYYTFTGDKLPVVRQKGKVLKTKVALSSFLSHTSDSGASLAPLITYAEEQVDLFVPDWHLKNNWFCKLHVTDLLVSFANTIIDRRLMLAHIQKCFKI